ncbi:MAG: hypothetical protein MJY91_06305 [Bacteroidales bacterium]|nr:hypothetical protein [Candidatus Cryptobacteroides choladohippi]MCQ2179691.1 hypothetical protein [Bacteroidales bacterium]
MCALDKQYFRFWRMMEEGTLSKDGKIDFRTACRRLRCSPADLDEVLVSELGIDGDEVVELYFGNGCNFY